jgi:GntR family transcriptional repressor for pyruvate dehydrogenase complex
VTSRAPDGLFTTVQRVRSFDDVVTQVRDAILSGGIAPGAKLPSERDLCELLGVSRTTVREALRALEALGFVEIRLGAHGGAFAKAPDAAMLGQALSTMLLFQQATTADLNEFRHSFEGENAYLAALHADTDDFEVFESIAAQARSARKDKPGWIELEQLDLRLHEAVTVATHNPVRVAIMSGIHDALKRNLEVLEPLSSYSTSLRKDMLALVDLLTARDAEGARAHMQRHLAKWQKISASPPAR